MEFHHVALALPEIASATGFLVGTLGGVADSGGPGDGFRWAAWRYAGGGRIEAIEPTGPLGFLHRFLTRRGPGIHHVTFKVAGLGAACDRAGAAGFQVVDRDERDPDWQTAYLRPREALGIVVQLGQASGRAPLRPAAVPPGPPGPPSPVAVVGLRMRARSAHRARRLWGTVLGGQESGAETDDLVYRWEGSPMRIAVEIAPAADEGPVAIEVASERALRLPAAPVPGLGTVFVERPHVAG